MKICIDCHHEFKTKIKVDNKIHNLSHRQKCLDCAPINSKHNQTSKEYMKKRISRKEEFINALGGRCSSCAYNECIDALSFHHIDSSMKVFAVSKILNHNLKKLTQEINKCIILCRNCHSTIHHDTYCLYAGTNSEYKRVKIHRHKVKIASVVYKGGKCQICGYSRCKDALVFHHFDPSKKSFSIGHSIISWNIMRSELDKCILLCGNCHAEVHAGIKSVTAEMITPHIHTGMPNNTVKIADKCTDCGVILKNNSQRCLDCSRMNRRKIIWPSVDVLDTMLKNMSRSTLAKKLGVSDNAIKKHMAKMSQLS